MKRGRKGKKNLTPALEDYLKTVYEIVQTQPVARVSTIARRMNVSFPSVTNAMKRLKELGYVDYEKYGLIQLTEKGKKRAEVLRSAQVDVREFLIKVLKLPEENAVKIACKIEHFMEEELLDRLREFTDIIVNVEKEGCDRLLKFLKS